MRRMLQSFVLAGLLALLCFGTTQAGTLVLGGESQSSATNPECDAGVVKEVPDIIGGERSDNLSQPSAATTLTSHDGGNSIAADAREVLGYGRDIRPVSVYTVLEVIPQREPHLML